MTLFDRKAETEPSAVELYIRALNCMIDGNVKKAMAYLKDSVRIDTNNIDAYLKLGMLYRKINQPSRAYRIQKELTVRPNLPRNVKLEILQNMVLSLKDKGDYEKALYHLKEILEIDKKFSWAWHQRIQIYETMGNWTEAFNAYKQCYHDRSEDHKKRLACYKVEEGSGYMAENRLSDARECFNEAVKLYLGLPAPYVYAGDTYMMENDPEQALGTWEQLIMDAPQKSSPVFTRFEKVTFDEGHFDDMERIYSYIIEKAPSNKYAFLYLGEFYFRKGEYERAVAVINRLLENDPESLTAHRNLVRYLENSSIPEPFLDVVHKLTDLIPLEITYKCSRCNAVITEPLVKCPNCKSYDSIEY